MAKASANIASVNPLRNLSANALVDQLGAVKAEIAAFEGREKALRDELLRRGLTEAEGARFNATVTQAVRWTLDTKAVKAEMGAPWWDARCRQSLVITVAVKPRVAIAKLPRKSGAPNRTFGARAAALPPALFCTSGGIANGTRSPIARRFVAYTGER